MMTHFKHLNIGQKNRVVDEAFKPIAAAYPHWPDQAAHLGYFWLAYDYANLLPSCADCNRYRHYDDGGSGGKADRFPIAGQRMLHPEDDPQAEEALLLDPSVDDPNVHFTFLPNGLIRACSERGEATLRMFALNLREELVKERRSSYNATWNALRSFLIDAPGGSNPSLDEWRETVNGAWCGQRAYAAFGRLALADLTAAYAQRGVSIALPLPQDAEPPPLR